MINVLIVEDDPMVVELNKCYVEQVESFQCIGSASSIKEAIEFLEHNHIQLILLDIYMRGETGFELAAYLREKGMDIDIIFITAARDTSNLRKAIQYGAMDYIMKPFSFERFKKSLLRYAKQIELIQQKNTLNQNEIDTMLFTKDRGGTSVELPKGLTTHTLQLIWERIKSMEGRIFSTEELVTTLHLSRVSIRKYLNFMEDLGVIEGQIEYGTVGRPVRKHRYRQDKEEMMNEYL
ncbi:response regulator [Priestia taiwanensis]|uniref:Two-component system response regulator DcuR n=1 Tax=Priestia taiwanensis TaxID=1347902 RepID=A0A917ERP6_9BACI|nr:response regulator [Priestia taiwanensis]MBM7364895.1 CitB family two-component system response regulator MalR [Priestia taiwanensis]GGE82823.1 two-component system response regulator DcuR [Priestia taiwanensis]